MAKRKAGEGGATSDPDRPQSVESAVRAAARSIEERLGQYPAPDELVDDEEFMQASRLLARPDVGVETVERLTRSSTPIIAAAADRAIARRGVAGEDWLAWAFRRLRQAYAGELVFLLEAIERYADPPLIARVLANSDDDWSEGWCLGVISSFVERRVRAGEEPTAADFDVIDPTSEETVADVVTELEGVLPSATIRDFEQWRRRRADTQFFSGVGRIWRPVDEPPSLMSVGGRAEVLSALESALRVPGGNTALLIGEHGIGKSAVLRTMLRRLHAQGWFIFEASATELMAGQVYIGQIDARLREIADRVSGRPVLWVMPAFEETIHAAQHERSTTGVLDRLFPYLESGRVLMVGELEPSAYERVVRERPRVASLFEGLRLKPLTREETRLVAEDWRDQTGTDIDDATIGDALDLAEHYLAAIAAPGRVLRLLKATEAIAHADGDQTIGTADLLKTLSETTGLPLHVVDPQAPLDLGAVRAFFATRIIGQPEAVDCIVDRIALIKAGLTDPTRPLGVFLFVGPTGTGKTELAKALAEFLFGSPDRLVRLDMSEFQTADSLERLLAGSTERNEGAALISSVRRNPFSVVLLDEFEKAHRRIWNVFPQLFDDGRLTDDRGRTADFRQCVVILTSNLGAAVERGGRLGFVTDVGPRFRPAAVERVVEQVFRPELRNRIDRIVVFRPFEREQMRALLQRELMQVLTRRGFRSRPWAVEWDEAALEFLAEKGFSADLGARPLKRAVERYLLAPLANAIVARSFPAGEQFLFITARNGRIEATFVDPDAEQDTPERVMKPGVLRLERLVAEPTGAAGELVFLQERADRLRAVINGDRWQGQKERDLEAMRDESFWESPDRHAVLARVEYVDRVQAAFRTAEKLLVRLDRQRRNGHGSTSGLVELLAERLYLLDCACGDGEAAVPSDAFLEIRASPIESAEQEFALQLREMYEAWGRRRGMRVRRLWSDGNHLLSVSGIGAYQILARESGLHIFESPRENRPFDRVAVNVAVAPVTPAPPDEDTTDLARRALAALPQTATVVRRYRERPSPLVRDSVREWRTGRLDRVLAGEFDVISDG
jgi:ATP-dependent Clp protease ATP-binding subunit ClpC